VISRRRLLTGFVLAWAPLGAAAAQEYKAGKVHRLGLLIPGVRVAPSSPVNRQRSAFRAHMRSPATAHDAAHDGGRERAALANRLLGCQSLPSSTLNFS
jgi:hypothetical protein